MSRTTVIVSVCFLLGFTGRLGAMPLDRSRLPAATHWLLHIDFDAARKSKLFNSVIEEMLNQPSTKAQVRRFHTLTGTDALVDLHSATVFNTTFEKDSAVLVINSRLEKEKVLRIASVLPDHTILHFGTHDIHTWSDKRTHRTTAGSFWGDDVVVMGPNLAGVETELDVLDGRGTSLASVDRMVGAAPSAGTFIEAAITDLKSAPIESPVFRNVEEIHVMMGDGDGTTFVHGQMVTQSPQMAHRLRRLADGLKEFPLLLGPDHPAAEWMRKLLDPVSVTADGVVVHVDLECPTVDASTMIRDRLLKAMSDRAANAATDGQEK